MASIVWDESLSLGVETLDSQHKHLIALSNKLLAARIARPSTKQLLKILHEFREYTIYHFIDEEEYMASIDYPRLKEHRKEHDGLKEQVKDIQNLIIKNGSFPEDEVLEFLKRWLIGHILQSDLEIKTFIQNTRDGAHT